MDKSIYGVGAAYASTTLSSDYYIDDNRTLGMTFSNITNISDENIYYEPEPTRDSLYIVIPITIIFTVIFLTGVIGNISTCIVIARNKSMHTATNYYLFSLAISDLLLLVSGLPQEVYYLWYRYPYIFGETFCVLRGMAAETSANATVLTITAFTVERYVAICHPFLSHTMSKLSRAIKLILAIWVVALGFAIPLSLQFGLVSHRDVVVCTHKRVLLEHSFEISTLLFFVAPMTLIMVLYALIGLRLRTSDLMKKERGPGGQGSQVGQGAPLRPGPRPRPRRAPAQSSRRVLKMLVAVVVAFFICWAPFHAQRLVALYGTSGTHTAISPTMHTIYVIMTHVSGVLYYMSTTINPVLYHIMSNKFREAFKETLAQCCGRAGRGRGEGGGRSYSVLSRSNPRHAGVRVSGHDSTDYSGNSVREESLASGNQAVEPLRGGRGGRRETRGWDSARPPCSACPRPYTTNVTYKTNFPTTVHIHFNDKETNTGFSSDFHIESPEYSLNNPALADEHCEMSRTPLWSILKCVAPEEDDGRYRFSPSRTKLTVENETQTDCEAYTMTHCFGGGCPHRDIDRDAIEDELTSYMEEIHRREKKCNKHQFAV